MSAPTTPRTRGGLAALAVGGFACFLTLVAPRTGRTPEPVDPAAQDATFDAGVRLAAGRAGLANTRAGVGIEPRRSAAAHLDELQLAFEARDSVKVSVLIQDWLADRGVEELLATLGDGRPNAEVGDALAMILRTAVIRAADGDRVVAPWTATELIGGALDTLAADVANATILFAALHDRGADATAEHLLELLAHQDGLGSPFADFTHQVDTIRLMQAWAPDLPADVVPVLDATLSDPERLGAERGRAASLLLHRDWRANTERVLDVVADLRVGPLDELDLVQQDLRLQIGEVVGHLEPHERGEFLALLAADVDAFRVAADALEPGDAAEWAARLDQESIGPVAHATLRLRAGGDDALDAGLELLPTLRARTDFSAQACVHTLLTLDGAGDPRVHETLAGLFEERESRRDPFWRALGWHPHGLSDRQLEEAVLPWLLLSVGEEHPSRARLVAHVQDRFPGRYPEL